MAFHTIDGAAFMGLRERGGHYQIVYDHRSGIRRILTIGTNRSSLQEINDALKEATNEKDALAALVRALTLRRIEFFMG